MNVDQEERNPEAPRNRCSAGAATTENSGENPSPRPTEISLPVASAVAQPKIKKSKMGPRRAAVLIGVHLLIVGHVVHYMMTGRTVTPVEPSESMYTLEKGMLNAGFVFFAVSLVSVLLVGRYFCGWGCHLVAYQDLCGWIMKKMHVKPKPLRSRLLVFVPLGLAIYMFVYPSVMRVLFPEQLGRFPGFSRHLVTDDFWKTFPGPVFTILTIVVCGFLAVYFLGAKGFCTFGCPYGGFFGLFDRASVGRILVNDACEQCGHCTATCTSNVRVHEEVNLYGMVVDPGCMKCMDCVSVCPNDALRFGFGPPSVFKRPATGVRAPARFDFTWPEDIALALIFLASTLTFRGLYDGPPLLMSVALGGVTAYIALKSWRVARDPTVRIQNWRIKTAGALGAGGIAYVVVAACWLGFTGHSGFIRWHQVWGRYYLNRTEATEADVFSGVSTQPGRYSHQHDEATANSERHFALADRWGLTGTLEVQRGLVWLNLLRGDDAMAELYARAAMAKAPEAANLHEDLVKIFAKQQKWAKAIESTRQVMSLREATAADHFQLAGLYVQTGQVEPAIEQFRACIAADPTTGPAYYNLGGLLGRNGRFVEAIENLERARQLMPTDADTHAELGIAYASTGRFDDAVQSLRRAIELDPQNPLPKMQLDLLLRNLQPEPTGRNADRNSERR